MDLTMPRMGGIEATRLIRQTGLGRDKLPIIAVTANALASEKAECFKAGISDFLAKPLIPIALRTAIVKHTGVAIAHQMASERAAAGKR
jgi:CheY-like chemotaxis protein